MGSRAVTNAMVMVVALAVSAVAGAQENRMLADGKVVRGVLGTGAEVWTFEGAAGEEVQVTLGSAAFDTVLEEIIGASLEATGGREAMARVESVRQAGTLLMSTPFGDLEGSVESIIIPNRRLYQRIDLDVFGRTTGWNGVAVWQSDNTQGVIELTGPEGGGRGGEVVAPPVLGLRGHGVGLCGIQPARRC